MLRVVLFAMAGALWACDAQAQTVPTPPLSAPADAKLAGTGEGGGKAWWFNASVFTYIVPEDRNLVQPVMSADNGRLHLEARYNYEDLDTASAWIGYNFSFGEKVTLDLTPMVGGVVGRTDGVAPGYRLTLDWWKLELYSETEFVFDAGGLSDSFLYTWSELTVAPLEWFRFGLVVQRTKLYQTQFDIQRGLLLRFSIKSVDLTACIFNPDASRPTYVLGAGVGF